VSRRALVALVVVLAAGGCTRSNAASGGGAEVDFCGGYEAYDLLAEPDPTDTDSVVGYASSVLRVLDRIDDDVRVDGADLPDELIDHLDLLAESMRELRSGATESLVGAESKLFFSDDARQTDAALTQFYDAHCGENAGNDNGLPVPTAAAESEVTPEQLAVAVEIADRTVANDWAAIRADFDDTLTEMLTEELLTGTWARVTGEVGAFVRRAEPVTGPRVGDVISIDITFTFERGDLVLRVALEPDGKIAGYFFLPPGG
jgi:hypothetical protein